MTDLELLKATFDKLGVNYTIMEEVGKFQVPGTGERDFRKNDKGEWVNYGWKNSEMLAYDTRLDTQESWGHAELAFFFKDGKKVCHAGYEI